MTSAPLAKREDFKLLLREGIAKLCPPGIVTREYNSLQFATAKGEPGTHGSYLLVGLSTLSLTTSTTPEHPTLTTRSCPRVANPYSALACSFVLDPDHAGSHRDISEPTHPRRDRQLSQGEIPAPRPSGQKSPRSQVDHHLPGHRAVGRIRPQICGLGEQPHPPHLHRRFDPRRRYPSLWI